MARCTESFNKFTLYPLFLLASFFFALFVANIGLFVEPLA